MSTKGTLSVNQMKTYGDQKMVDDFGSATKPSPVTGAPVPDRGPGRPTGTTTASPAPAGAGQFTIPPEHIEGMKSVAEADLVRRYFETMAKTFPNAWTRRYAMAATSDFEKISQTLYETTPNGE